MSPGWAAADLLVAVVSDCRVRESAHGGRVHPAALPGHPGEHGAQQPEPVPEDCRGDHCGAAHFPPASVSVHPAMV